jgi:hypothetical protein
MGFEVGHTAGSDNEAFPADSPHRLLKSDASLEDRNQVATEEEEEHTAELNETAGLWGEMEMRDTEDFIERVLRGATRMERGARRKSRGRTGKKWRM